MHAIRRSDCLLDEETALQIIDQAVYATVSCIDETAIFFPFPYQ